MEGFVSGFGVGDVDVEDEDAGFGAGDDADSVAVVGAGEPFGDEIRVCCGFVLPGEEGRAFFSWSDGNDSPATLSVVECCRERFDHWLKLSKSVMACVSVIADFAGFVP